MVLFFLLLVADGPAAAVPEPPTPVGGGLTLTLRTTHY